MSVSQELKTESWGEVISSTGGSLFGLIRLFSARKSDVSMISTFEESGVTLAVCSGYELNFSNITNGVDIFASGTEEGIFESISNPLKTRAHAFNKETTEGDCVVPSKRFGVSSNFFPEEV